MTDATDGVPPEPPESFLDGSEPLSDDEDPAKGASQALMPSDFAEPNALNRSEEDDAESE